MVNFKKLGRFNTEVINLPYYEVVNYVANYAQQMLETLLGSVTFPLDIDSLFESLNIRIEKGNFFDNSSGFVNGYMLNETFFIADTSQRDSNDIRYSRIKCLAYLITNKRCRMEDKYLETTYHDVIYNFSYLANILALSIVLPWKTTICFFDEISFFNENCSKYEFDKKIRNLSCDLRLPQHDIVLAYYNWQQVLDVKRNFYQDDLNLPQYKNLILN